jgi:hypothetical protein
MMRILKRLLLILATLGFGALAYALLRAEGERALRPATGGPREEPPGAPRPAPQPGPVEAPRRCAAVTASGKPCAREVQPGSEYCWQHGG